MEKKDLKEIVEEIKGICEVHPDMDNRFLALKIAGYRNINYHYLNGKTVLYGTNNGLYKAMHLKKKGVFRILIGNTEMKKGFPAGWCLEIPSEGVVYKQENFFTSLHC